MMGLRIDGDGSCPWARAQPHCVERALSNRSGIDRRRVCCAFEGTDWRATDPGRMVCWTLLDHRALFTVSQIAKSPDFRFGLITNQFGEKRLSGIVGICGVGCAKPEMPLDFNRMLLAKAH